jgi:hypothetical protein
MLPAEKHARSRHPGVELFRQPRPEQEHPNRHLGGENWHGRMNVTVGTFNLNNLFGRWNLYVEVPETRALPGAAESAAVEPPRDWLEEPPPLAGTRDHEARDADPPDVKIVLEGDLVAGRIKWRTNPASGKVVFRKSAEARRVLAARIKAIDADVLALQEVESIEALEEFVDEERLDEYRHLVLVEGNDERLIDVALMSRFPIGAVTSWRTAPTRTARASGRSSRATSSRPRSWTSGGSASSSRSLTTT